MPDPTKSEYKNLYMKQTLQLKISQSLTMTPQLQQAIRLLQLSGIELQEEIQQTIDSNPMLEQEEDGGERSESSNQDSESEQIKQQNTEERNELETTSNNEAIPEDLPVDSNWEDTFDNSYTSGLPAGDSDRDFEVQGQTSENLNDHLIWQMEVSPFTDTDKLIAIAIIDAIDEDGYLSVTLEDIHSALPVELEIDLDEILAVLHRIQHFDPPGVAARGLRESMLNQLKQLDQSIPWIEEATKLTESHFDLLANREFNQLMRRLKLSESDLQQVITLIQTLNPRPGTVISSTPAEYIVPDVFVRKDKDKWLVDLNPDVMPKLRINNLYANMIKRANNSSDNVYLKNQLQEARWFIKSLHSRSETLLKVAQCIVRKQQAFLDHGEEAMKPLVMFDIAEEVEMHESTISRVTTKKYMHTPQGIYELKYFFSSHVSTSSGGECSSTAIRAMIKKLIAAESPGKPLSDSKIATMLSDKGIQVARRTVAKYREAMRIPPSNERKRLI